MKTLKGTKTERNLMAAFAGESQARNKYTFFASVAKKEGYEQLAAIFEFFKKPQTMKKSTPSASLNFLEKHLLKSPGLTAAD